MEFLKAEKYFSTNHPIPTKLFSHFAPQNFILSTLKEYFAIHRRFSNRYHYYFHNNIQNSAS